jgi:protein-disulfide isomerase
VYGEGRDPEHELAALGERLNAPDADALITSEVKQQLVSNTQMAVDLGVFGVPTLAFGGRFFWGSDTVDWALQFINEPNLFQQPGYEAVTRVQFGVARK